MWFGSAYYPERWTEERWLEDSKLMSEAGFNLARMGEFAWCRMEPEKDKFNFDWLEKAVECLNNKGISILIGTPTAGPPAWLVNGEPDCRQLYENGVKWEFGGRSMCCVNHPYFRERSNIIAEALGRRFGEHPGVMGFQIDNEVGMYGARCYCPECVRGFQRWMKEKYKTIDECNRRLGMLFGSGEFRSFEDIPMPRLSQGLHNPGLLMDSVRFFADGNASFLYEQAQAIRQTGSNKPITHNVCHMLAGSPELDGVRLFKNLDIAGWDCYPSQFANNPSAASMGLLHTIARGYKNKRYWMLEMQSGSPDRFAAIDMRRIRLWTWQSIAYGAEMILYFTWRTCPYGGEQYWRGILDHDGKPNYRYSAIKAIGNEIGNAKRILDELSWKNEAALLLDPDACSSFAVNSPGAGLAYRGHAQECFSAITQIGRGCDVLFDAERLSEYKVIVAPMLRLMDSELAEKLKEFVMNGGTFIATPLLAALNRDHSALEGFPPYFIGDLMGFERFEWSSLAALEAPPKEMLGDSAFAWQSINSVGEIPIRTNDGKIYPCRVWLDHIRATSAQVLASVAEGSTASGLPALTVNSYGKGKAYYSAGFLDWQILRNLFEEALGKGDFYHANPYFEVSPAWHGDRRIYFILNHEGSEKSLDLPRDFEDILSGERLSGSIKIDGYGVRIIGEI